MNFKSKLESKTDLEINLIDERLSTVEATNYLLNEGLDKICKKVGEEATETVIAAKNENKEELIGEICDLVYHVEMLMFNKGVEPNDIRRKLTQRHKIENNKKKKNIRGEY